MWKNLSNNLVWRHENFFSEEAMTVLEEFLKSSDQSSIKSSQDQPIFSNSKFHYHLHHAQAKNHPLIFNELKKRLDVLFQENDEPPFPCPPLKTSQAMIKFFSHGSKYDLHTENQDTFGPWVYVVYLSDEETSPIQFLSKPSILKLIRGSEYKNWEVMASILEKQGQPLRYVGKDLNIFPQKNTGIAFRCGIAHRIPIYENSSNGRYCLTGWPFANLA